MPLLYSPQSKNFYNFSPCWVHRIRVGGVDCVPIVRKALHSILSLKTKKKNRPGTQDSTEHCEHYYPPTGWPSTCSHLPSRVVNMVNTHRQLLNMGETTGCFTNRSQVITRCWIFSSNMLSKGTALPATCAANGLLCPGSGHHTKAKTRHFWEVFFRRERGYSWSPPHPVCFRGHTTE